MTDYSELEAQAQGASSAPPPPEPYHELVAASQGQPSPPAQTTAAPESYAGVRQAIDALKVGLNHPLTAGYGLLENAASSAAGTIGKAAGRIADLSLTVTGLKDPRFSMADTLEGMAYQPRTEAGKEIARIGAAQSASAGAIVNKLPGANTPLGQTLLEAVPEAITDIGMVKGAGAALKGAPVAKVSAVAPEAAGFDMEPVEGGVSPAAASARAQVLQRVGLLQARNSALEGNAKNAATDFQLSKFDEPAGIAAKAQFDAERAALQAHTQGIIERVGGTLGTDEDSLNLRGQTLAEPFDRLQQWLDNQRTRLYAAADTRAGGAPQVQPTNFKALLNDPSFQNQLTARGQSHLLGGVKSEFDRFMANNPQGLTVTNAEQFRQFMNSAWTPENSSLIGRLKGALDEDVTKNAGEDIYGPARALSKLEKQTLQNPNGIARLLERDPQTPINRTTPYTKIPDTITRLDPAQFSQVVSTLKEMPEEIQPAAQAALGEIKGHLVNKLYDAGNSDSVLWNARKVGKVMDANSSKLAIAFADDMKSMQDIHDLRSAGNILAVNQGYPGAAAQAANAAKRGFMSQTLGRLGATGGAAAGSVLGPAGAAGGAVVGQQVGQKLGGSLSERAALKRWQAGTTSLSDLMAPQP